MIDSTNPKDKIGAKKPNLHLVPSVLTIHTAKAMENGAAKFGPFNWRGNKVKGSIYISAALRHIHSYFDGEDKAKDSGVHHLGHAAACLGILLDAMETGNLVDDRPVAGKAAEVIERETVNDNPHDLQPYPGAIRVQIAPFCPDCGATTGTWHKEGCFKPVQIVVHPEDKCLGCGAASGKVHAPECPMKARHKSIPCGAPDALKPFTQHTGTYPCVECGCSPGEDHTTSCKRFWEKIQDACPNLRFLPVAAPEPEIGQCYECGAKRGDSHSIECKTLKRKL